jgi:hypothetical protein
MVHMHYCWPSLLVQVRISSVSSSLFFVLCRAKFLLSSYMFYHQANESLVLLLHFRLTSPSPFYFQNVEVIAQIILMLIVV